MIDISLKQLYESEPESMKKQFDKLNAMLMHVKSIFANTNVLHSVHNSNEELAIAHTALNASINGIAWTAQNGPSFRSFSSSLSAR